MIIQSAKTLAVFVILINVLSLKNISLENYKFLLSISKPTYHNICNALVYNFCGKSTYFKTQRRLMIRKMLY